MKKLLLCLMAMMLLLSAGCSNDNGGASDNAALAGIINGEEVPYQVYTYFLDSMFGEYYSYAQMFGLDMLDEESASSMLPSIEQAAWETTVQSVLIRQVARDNYGAELEEVYYQQLLSPGYAINLDVNRYYNAIYADLTAEVQATKVVSEDDARAAYDADPAAWDNRQVAHIIIMNETGDQEGDQAARAQATELIAMLDDGADFAELAAEYGQDGTAASGGVMDLYFNASGLGVGSSGSFDSLFAAGAFALEEVGDYSATPVESSFGYHIIQLLDVREGFEVNRDAIMSDLAAVTADDITAYFQEMLAEAQANANIECLIDFRYNAADGDDDAGQNEDDPATEE